MRGGGRVCWAMASMSLPSFVNATVRRQISVAVCLPVLVSLVDGGNLSTMTKNPSLFASGGRHSSERILLK